MKGISVFIPAATLLCTLMMLFLNISVYQSGNWIWTSILLSIGIFLTIVSYFLMILKNKQAFLVQLLGTFLSLIYIIPLFFKTFLALLNGQNKYLFSFLTMCIILFLQFTLSINSYRNIETLQKER
jgi:hypothetical protein